MRLAAHFFVVAQAVLVGVASPAGANHAGCAAYAKKPTKSSLVGLHLVNGQGGVTCTSQPAFIGVKVCIQYHVIFDFWNTMNCGTNATVGLDETGVHTDVNEWCVGGTHTYRTITDYNVEYVQHVPASGSVPSPHATFVCPMPALDNIITGT